MIKLDNNIDSSNKNDKRKDNLVDRLFVIAGIPISIICPVLGMSDIKYSYDTGMNEFYNRGLMELGIGLITGVITGYMIHRYIQNGR